METNKDKIIGPALRKLQEIRKASEEKLPDLYDELEALLEKVQSSYDSLQEKYDEIRKKNDDLEERIKELNSLLDKWMAETSPGDLACSRVSCEIIYKGYWDKLDEFSKKYLTMANYLYKLFSQEDADYSPSILEFGRAMENELVVKIYNGFVQRLSGHTDEMSDDGGKYVKLTEAVKYFGWKSKYYIPARAMVMYLGYLSDERINNDYNEALKKYLEDSGVDKRVVSEEKFVSDSDELFDEYRNNAAHPGSIMGADMATNCRERTKKVLKRFMSALPSGEQIK